MKFRTEIDFKLSSSPLDPQRSVVLLGSCFTDSIGNRMRHCLWRALPNICGVLYNPASIARIIRLACASPYECQCEVTDSIAQRDTTFISWLMDSSVASSDPQSAVRMAVEKLTALKKALAESFALIVTFGTAWIYELSSREGYVVSNCHKFPARDFTRRRLSVDEIAEEWRLIVDDIRRLNPEIKIIFTVSPIRHLKDGFEGNCRSKATLLLACERLTEECRNVEYFPSYEVLNDDLRDYRFYASDLVHPSAEAVEYIWEKFCDRYLTPEGKTILTEGEKIRKALDHRQIVATDNENCNNGKPDYKAKAIKRYEEFITRYPGMSREDE